MLRFCSAIVVALLTVVVSFSVRAQDAPVIEYTAPSAPVASNQPFKMQVRVFSDVPLQRVTVHYLEPGSPNASQDMQPVSPEQYELTFPAASMQGENFKFYIEACTKTNVCTHKGASDQFLTVAIAPASPTNSAATTESAATTSPLPSQNIDVSAAIASAKSRDVAPQTDTASVADSVTKGSVDAVLPGAINPSPNTSPNDVVPEIPRPQEKQTSYWGWVLGVVAVGALAALASGGGGGGGSDGGSSSTSGPSTPPQGTLSVTVPNPTR